MQPAAMQKHAGEDRRPGRDHRQLRRQLGVTEQGGGDQAVLVSDHIRIVRELPQKGADAHADQPVGDHWRLADRVVVVEREGEDHARLLGSQPARLARSIKRITTASP